MKAPHLAQVLRYARETAEDTGIEEMQRLGCRRFLRDLEDPRWEFRTALPEFCIETMTGLFSFSRAGQWLGGRKWFRWIVAVPCLFSFVLAASNLITAGFRWDIILVRLIQFLVQPVTVWLVVVIRNAVKNRPARKNAFNPDNA